MVLCPPSRGLLGFLVCLAAGCAAAPRTGGGRDAPPELEASWDAFLRDDPSWPARRDEWLEREPADRYQLLEALYAVLIHLDEPMEPGRDPLWQRARKEIVWIGAEAIPLLRRGLIGLAERPRQDLVALDRTGIVLADLHAVDEMTALLEAQTPAVRHAAVRVLARMDEAEATAALTTALQRDPEWTVRAQAVEGLAPWVAEAAVAAALWQALEDPDPLVREKAARALGRLRDPQSQDALVRQYDRALQRGDARLADALHAALCDSTRLHGAPRSAAQWRAILEELRRR